MRRLEKIELCGEEFTIKARPAFVRSARFEAWKTAYCDRGDLYNHYKKPSGIKLAIWHDWCDWAAINNAYLQVRSANTNFFTIEGLLWYNGKFYYIDITSTHNWLFPIEIVEV